MDDVTAAGSPRYAPRATGAGSADGGKGGAARSVWGRLRFPVGLGIIGALVWRLGTGAFRDGLELIDGRAVLLSFGVSVLTTVLSAWRWYLVARGLGLRLAFGAAVGDYYRALFLNAALPGGVVGDVHRGVSHGRSEGDVGQGVRAVFLERVAGLAALVAVAVLSLPAWPDPIAARVADTVSSHGLWVAGVLCVLVLALAAGMQWGRRRARWRRAVATVLADVRQGLLARDVWPMVSLLSFAVVAGHLAVFLVAARAAGSTVGAGRLLPLMVLALLAMALPVNVGGWGPREGTLAVAFGATGLAARQGLTIAVIYGVLTFLASLPGACVMLVRWSRRPAPADGGSGAGDGAS